MHYRAFGLRLRSELDIPELEPAEDGAPDVEIVDGCAPTTLDDVDSSGVTWQANSDETLIDVREIARFHVIAGRRIVIERHPGVDADDVRPFLLGSAMGALLQQRGLLVLHASAVATPQGAVAFAGPSGVGKSTLLAGLLERGHRMISDDLAAIHFQAGQPVLVPSFPTRRLWRDAAQKLGTSLHGRARVRAELDKYVLPVPGFSHDPAPLHGVYVLRTHNRDEVRLEPVRGADRAHWLIRFTYRRRYLGGSRCQAHVESAARVARVVDRFALCSRPLAGFALDQLVDRLEADW